jgi:molybdopterin-guanine dinucleotide biosynthesis protein A
VNKFNEVLIVANDPIKHLSSDKIVTIEDFKKNLGPLGWNFKRHEMG